jgi:drug/metabolite transporter (DMT)-like permease
MIKPMTILDWAILGLAALLLGSTFVFMNIAVSEVHPFTVAAARAMVAAPICWALMMFFGAKMPRSRKEWIVFFWLGVMTAAIPFGTVAWGQQHIESGLAGILFGTSPIMSVILAPLFLKEESLTSRRLIGSIIGFIGIVVLIGPSVLANATDQILGGIITLLAPISHTLGAIYARHHPKLAPPAMATGQMIFGSIILLPLAFYFENSPAIEVSGVAIGAMVWVGIATAFAMSLYFLAVKRVGAARVSLVPLFFPVVAIILGFIILKERLSVEAFLGLALILTGAIAVSSSSQKN